MNAAELKEMERLNQIMTRKALKCWALSFFYFFVCITFPQISELIGEVASKIFPSIEKLNQKNNSQSSLNMAYLGGLLLMAPLYGFYFLLNENPLLRWRFGVMRTQRSWGECIFFAYFLGLPLFLAILIVVYVAPLDEVLNRDLRGSKLLNLMIGTRLGLLILGSSSSIAIAALVFFIAMVIILPVFYLFNKIKRKRQWAASWW